MTVAVIGAGVTGLALAHGLRRQGVEVCVLEAADRAGGVIRTLSRDGFLLETAANGYLDREPATTRLVEALGLTSSLRTADASAKTRLVYTRGKLRTLPSSPPGFLASDVVPLASRLRALWEPFTPRSRKPDESLAEFGRRHLGEGITRVLVDAVQRGIFAGDVDRLSVAAAFPRLAELERRHRSLLLGALRERPAPAALTTFDGGMQVLVDALTASLGGSLRLRARVEGLTPDEAGWQLRLGGGEVLRAARVVLALPADASAALLRAQAPALATELSAIPYAPVTVLHLGFRHLDTRPPRGFGFLVPAQEGRRVLGVLFVSSFFPHRVPEGATLLTVMLGGARDPGVAALDDEATSALGREELRELIGLTAAPDLVEVVRWPRGIPQYEVGHLARLERIDAAAAELPGLVLAGSAYRGVGVNDCLREAERLVLALGAPSDSPR
jgi:oxygen-dependent protoporphyrinogen oxidase